ncbi:MAG: hypothetical protein HKN52_12975 [Eudoraea sp.]|nr:hypothetical protein [Eudoraea sp.]
MKILPILCLAILLFVSCKKEGNTEFSITKDQVGKVTRTTLIKDLETIYADDSLVRKDPNTELGTSTSKIEIFQKGGDLLLSITPNTDSLQTIENIRIYDPRFSTAEGINLLSTFKDIKTHYTIKKVLTSMNNVVILLKESDLYFTISKEELPAELRFGSTNIDAVQIPDEAAIKYMMIGWE